MAEVVPSDHHRTYAGSFDFGSAGTQTDVDLNAVSAMANSVQSRTALLDWQEHITEPTRRPASASMRIDIPTNAANTHKRAASTLPSFSFNASDTSGRQDATTPPHSPEENVSATPSRGAHRRGGSEFVGGDSRLGLSNALSSSPVKSNASSVMGGSTAGPPQGRRGHAHRRSAAISSHDVAKLMQPPTDTQPRLSSSLPNTPLEYSSPPTDTQDSQMSVGAIADPFGPPLEDLPARPPSRPRVGFSDNIEFIPRPLSTISSGTESSLSTIRGHSVNNSISSVLSLSTPSPPSSRMPRILARTDSGDNVKPSPAASPEKSLRVGQEGQWLKQRSSDSLARPVSESAVYPRTTFIEPEPVTRSRKRSSSHALGVDRRRSEPSFGMSANESSRLSTISLQEAARGYSVEDAQEEKEFERKSSARRMKDWAVAKISKKTKEGNKALTASSSSSSLRPVSAGSIPPEPTIAVAETDLDAVLSHPDMNEETDRSSTSGQSRIEVNTPASSQYSSGRFDEPGDSEAMLDLDAALGPFKTPPIGSHRQRKELHSSRLTKDFTGPGGHYHRRAESAPNLSPFEFLQEGNVAQAGMADVFEEDEEDVANPVDCPKPTSVHSNPDVESETGTQGDPARLAEHATPLEGLGIQEIEEPERPLCSVGHSRPLLSNLAVEGRGSSIIDETIFEEPNAMYDIEIVQAHEEPRASSLTKSSDSSDTPTLLVPPGSALNFPSGERSLSIPETYQPPTYSSPTVRPGSLSSSNTGEHGQDMRFSVEVPSLTSSRSTMISTMHGNSSRRDVADIERASSVTPNLTESASSADMRRKRGSIQSLSQLMPFASKPKVTNETRPQTSVGSTTAKAAVKKENRLKKLVFWKTKQKSNREASSNA